ncbi:neuropeptides capa receptor-like [Saccostrea echinata]|uniref:neuropeptides capa receptor-like n=1 Tax=Saccostrea echinata TaxID=191078 RepID=UPI002A7FB378|nr:neuropeptides capa receptor-like [Saccostrea echinata]
MANLSAENKTFYNESHFSELDYLEQNLGVRHLDTPSLVILTTVYLSIFLSGTVGNICTCIVIARNRHMHTATNYYLFNLSVSDLATLILALPQELYMVWEAYPWRLGEGFCIIKAFVTEMSAYASILTITAFTFERWAAICHPMKLQKLSNLSRAIKEIIVIWILSSICALPYPIHTRTFYALVHPVTSEPLLASVVCSFPPEWRELMQLFLQLSSFVFFVLPMTLITLIYIRIGVTLYKSEVVGVQQNSSGAECPARKQRRKVYSVTQARKSVLKMLVAVVIAFFACWAPFHAQRLWTIYMNKDHWTPELLDLQNHVFFLSGVLYFFSATINPILYNLMSKKYRQAFRQTMCGRLRRHDPRSTYASSYSPSRQRTLNFGYSKVTKSTAAQFTIEETENTFAESRA